MASPRPPTAWTKERIIEQLAILFDDALGVDPEEVVPTARMVADLGAESIDFLDIFFRAEQMFGIRISRNEFPETNDTSMHDPLEPAQIDFIKTHMPFADLDKHQGASFSDICTVGFFAQFIAQKLNVS